MTHIVTSHCCHKRRPRWKNAVALGALALSTTLAVAQKVSSGDKVYDVHSEAQGTCPSLNWHIVASPDGVLTGMIAWDNMKVAALVSGTMERPVQIGRNAQPSNAQYRTFSMIANEQGGDREARITGTIWENGWLVANVRGAGVACQDIKMRWLSPTAQP
jgi:hypothetical protein